LKYSRFRETAPGDPVRSALRNRLGFTAFFQNVFNGLQSLFRSIPILGNILQIAATVIASAICGPVCAFAAATLTSAFVAGVTSGNLGAAMKAGLITAVTAAAFYGVGDMTSALASQGAAVQYAANVAGHAAVGCLTTMASGGSCGSGALGAGSSSAAAPLIDMEFRNPTGNLGDFVGGTAASSLVGGLASVAGGGKFANGAQTAAFGYMFNHVGHMLAGSDAHFQLLSYLQGRDPDMWQGNIGLAGTYGGGRPDLIYDSMPRDIFEIKPDGSAAQGAAQLQGYLNTPGAQSVAGNFDLIFRGSSSLTLTGGWFGDATYTYTSSAFPGVVTYSVGSSDTFEFAKNLFSQRPFGAPLPLPPRLPPILLP
jgi:hypothetical protein